VQAVMDKEVDLTELCEQSRKPLAPRARRGRSWWSTIR
jgi:hypothetical protein